MKVLALTVSVAAGVLLSACGRTPAAANAGNSRDTSVTVATAKPRSRPVAQRIELAGTVTAYEQVTVYARTSGYLKTLAVDIGDAVHKGQQIALLEAPEMLSELEETRAAVTKADAEVEQARAVVEQSRAEMEFASLNHQRLKAIHDRHSDVLPQQEVDQASAGLGVASGKWKAAQTQVAAAQSAAGIARAKVKTLETLMAYTRIEAPLSGIVTERFIDRGALIQTASTSRTQAAPIVSIARLDRLRLLVDVPESNVTQVRRGTEVTVLLLASGAQEITARVARVAGALDPASRTMRAEIDLSNPAGRLRPGMTAKVALALEEARSSLTVPVAALRVEGNERFVFHVRDGKARRANVRTGVESPDWIQILDGLKGEEDVIVAAAGVLQDGTLVSIRQ